MAAKMKKPVNGKEIAKVPVILQLEALECGAACLDMVLAYYGKWVPLEQVRKDCGVSRDGSTAKNVLLAARNYGMTAKGYRYEPDFLRENGKFPCIIHWNFNHFVVLDGFRGKDAVLNDPARGRVVVSEKDFDNAFTGICVIMEPGDGFEAAGHKNSSLDFFKARMKGSGAALAFFGLTAFVTTLISIVNPAFSRFFVDVLLTGSNPGMVGGFLLVLLIFTVIQLSISGIRELYSLKIEGKLAAVANTQFMWHVLCLPVEFFSQRMSGDISMRKSSNETVASSFSETLLPLIMNFIMIAIYAFIMIRYSWILTLIGVGSILLNLLLSRFVSNKSMNISRVMTRDNANLQSATVNAVDMIETIKAAGAENGYFSRWAGYQAAVNRQNGQLIRLNQTYSVLSAVITQVSGALVLGIGVLFILQGHFTIGLLLAFQTLLTTIEAPVATITASEETLRTMRVNMERIDDVMKYPTDVSYDSQAENETADYDKLSGRVELKNVTFGYSPLAAPLIENFSMTLESGKKVAFVGPSGCGKSTLSKLISGLYKPWSGEILFDGKPISEINRNVFTGSLAVVDQDITLFEDTIANNIRMWDDSIEDFEVILAARDASLHEDIMQRDGGYQYKMTEDGRDFSGGQRQRIEIARVLAQDPTIIIMDEATSALDAKTEFEVVSAIHQRGISCIVVAHRLSTIRDCDEIIVLDHGKITERGTHQELMNHHGEYEKLIMSE